jgi:hypothetical protein
MCKKADEIKVHWKPVQGDFFYGVPQDPDDMDYECGVYQFLICEDEFYSIIPDNYDLKKKEFTGFGDEDETVFLPRQDNLQDMIDFELPYDLIKNFQEWASQLDISMKERLQTMEQIWLAYVMFCNYSKEWTGKDWEHVSYN